MDIDPTNLAEVLRWLATGGATLAASFLLSEVAEKHWPGFHDYSPQAKGWIMVFGSAGLALLAHAAVTYIPAETLVALQPWFRVGVMAGLGALGTQWWHRVMQVKTLQLSMEPEMAEKLTHLSEAERGNE